MPGEARAPHRPIGTAATAVAALLLAAGAALLGAAQGWRQGALWLVGAALGLSLYHAAFGFAGAFRRLLAEGRGAGLRAQMLMLAVALLLFQPALAAGEVWGQPVRPFVFPAGAAMLLGAFLFGVGMQLGGGCASGTLYTVGGGSPRMLLTLGFFVVGATFAAWCSEWWDGLPALPPVSLPRIFGAWPALLGSLLVFALVWALSVRLERRRHGGVEGIWRAGRRRASLLSGPWPLAWGAVALALLNFATLLLSGRPWAITAAFPLWGSLAVDRLGWDDPVFWAYWEEPTRAEALLRPLLSDRTTVMDLGLMVGALLAASLAGRFAPGWRVAPGAALASVAGGSLLGVGAVLAFGCNISAYFSGIASGSLHGWAWIVPGLAGNWIGLLLRPLFGLDRPGGEGAAPGERGSALLAAETPR
jgi:uncharacterized membrane protein YedE/YeeE